MFLLSVLVYPAVLAALCLGAGLAVDRLAGTFVPGVVVAAVGAATLIGVAEITTEIRGLAPLTPEVFAALAIAGLWTGRKRIATVAREWRLHRWQLALPVLAYVLAAAPALFAGRPTFSAYMVLTDSALHMIGADYLIRFGQHYGHLDLLRSYGQYINNYYNMDYPTGSDALLGGSAFLLGVPVIWAFQPFNAFALVLAAGPAWLLARRIGLYGGWAAAATLAATLPALVYAYELIASIKEIVSLPLILTLGALVAEQRRWFAGGARAVLPFAIVVAGGVSTLGVAFGAWTVIAVLVLGGVIIASRSERARFRPVRFAALVGGGLVVLGILAWPTWRHTGGAVQITQAVAASPNRGNLVSPLRIEQVFGDWLAGSYAYPPHGLSLVLTDVLIGISATAAIGGALYLVRRRRGLAGAWIALMIVLGVVATRLGGVWSDAKTLVLSSSVVVLLAWAAVAALLAGRRLRAAALLALVLGGGVLVSDAIQYHDSDLAPTARYDELASIGNHYAGRGPTLFTDFDEYAMYELRDMDVGGPDFLYPPQHLSGIDAGHGGQVYLDHGYESALLRYPVIVARRDPTAVRPPSAYTLLWQGSYYQVWGRRPGARPAVARFDTLGRRPVACRRVAAVAKVALAHRGTLAAASPAEVVSINLVRSRRPRSWRHVAIWIEMGSAGTLSAGFTVPRAGIWDVWLQGEIMPTVLVRVDGRVIGSVGGDVGGDVIVPATSAPLPVRLARGRHLLAITRGGFTLAPGDGGSAQLTRVLLTPTGPAGEEQLHTAAAADWRSLCGQRFVWVEAVPKSYTPRSLKRLRQVALWRSGTDGTRRVTFA